MTADLTTQSPVEIDTQIAAIYVRFNAARRDVAVQVNYADNYQSTLDAIAAGTYRHFVSPSMVEEYTTAVERLEAKIADMKADALAILAEAKPYDAEWVRRGRWNRFFLVDNGSGHVHSSMDCSTTYPTTEWVWLPEYSDQDEAGLVALAKAQACTVCFPSAPVTRAKGSIENPAKRKSRIEREAAKATRDAAKAAKAIANEDGSPLTVFDWTIPARTYVGRGGVEIHEPARDRFETITTLAAAKVWLTDSQETYGLAKRDEDITRVADAIAAKVGTTAADEIAAAAKRAAKRK